MKSTIVIHIVWRTSIKRTKVAYCTGVENFWCGKSLAKLYQRKEDGAWTLGF